MLEGKELKKIKDRVALERKLIERIIDLPLRQRTEVKLYIDFMNELEEKRIAYLYFHASREAREKAKSILEESVKEKWPEHIRLT